MPVESSPGRSAAWLIEEVVGCAGDFHAREPASDSVRSAWWCVVDQPALVLGSAEDATGIDAAACAAANIPIVRRRSGGGAVLVVPGEIVWLDVIVPRGDTLWDDDVGRSMWWFGEAWAAALRSSGVADVSVHRGRQVVTASSPRICFDGVGAGEVFVGAAKAVGISQRRTRHWARLQSAVHLQWRPEMMVSLLAEPRPTIAELRPVWSAAASAQVLRAAVESALDAVLRPAERQEPAERRQRFEPQE